MEALVLPIAHHLEVFGSNLARANALGGGVFEGREPEPTFYSADKNRQRQSSRANQFRDGIDF
jgi:hypothetical protein